MRVKRLFSGKYDIVAVMDGDECPAEAFLVDGENLTESHRIGLMQILQYVAENGLQKAGPKWTHEADKALKIYEFIKGPLRLFFFKGEGGQIAVCTAGVRKSGNKADKASVKKAYDLSVEYDKAIKAYTLKVVD